MKIIKHTRYAYLRKIIKHTRYTYLISIVSIYINVVHKIIISESPVRGIVFYVRKPRAWYFVLSESPVRGIVFYVRKPRAWYFVLCHKAPCLVLCSMS